MQERNEMIQFCENIPELISGCLSIRHDVDGNERQVQRALGCLQF